MEGDEKTLDCLTVFDHLGRVSEYNNICVSSVSKQRTIFNVINSTHEPIRGRRGR